MARSRTHRRKRSTFRRIRRGTSRALSKGVHYAEEGVAGVYNALNQGFNYGKRMVIGTKGRRHRCRRHR